MHSPAIHVVEDFSVVGILGKQSRVSIDSHAK